MNASLKAVSLSVPENDKNINMPSHPRSQGRKIKTANALLESYLSLFDSKANWCVFCAAGVFASS